MDEPTLDPEYFERLKPFFLKLIRKFVKPSNVIHLLQESEMLTETDLSEIKATTNTKGEIEGSVLLFERLTLYEGWYPRLLEVLRDRDVKLSHVAREMEEIKGSLDTAIQEEQQISWHLGIPLFTRGMTSTQHPYDHSSMLLKLSDDQLVQRKKLMKLKVQLEQVQNELNEIKLRLREEENEAQLASDSEELQIKLARLKEEYSDYKLSSEKLEEEKDEQLKETIEKLQKQNRDITIELENTRKKLDESLTYIEQIFKEKQEVQTKLARLEKECSDYKLSSEKLEEEKGGMLKMETNNRTTQASDFASKSETTQASDNASKSETTQSPDYASDNETIQASDNASTNEINQASNNETTQSSKKMLASNAEGNQIVADHVLFLVGRSGNGKSFVRDSIARMVRSEGSDKNVSSKDGIAVITDRYNSDNRDSVINVCDGFSIDDNYFEACQIDALLDALRSCPHGFTALLIVLKYGVPFTKQEKDAISLIKYLLGEDCIRNYGIIVITYGDNFDLDHEDGDTHTHFSVWCREQRGDIQAVFQEVDNRFVIFNNRTKDESKVIKQWELLYDNVKRTKSKGFYSYEQCCENLLQRSERIVKELETTENQDVFDSKCKEAYTVLALLMNLSESSLLKDKEKINRIIKTFTDKVIGLQSNMCEQRQQQEQNNRKLNGWTNFWRF
ncbi:reticulocyte-binding protein homolog 2b-like [Physella acuta]|uniref:reticulocyte-binding protein homolog 2b-like n=1 Tax=Physella acuta TaxID=109671 RepID=UPI0027DBD453|nr:reticulocyte-binding protein homolog 2b-like [Physella acuta]